MNERRTIRYAWHADGFSVSRIGSDLAWPILDWDAMQPSNNFETTYNLEKCSVLSVAGDEWDKLTWTRKIPVEVKNQHRAFWGMKPLQKRGDSVTSARDFARGVNPNYSDDSIKGLDNQVRHLAAFVCDNPAEPTVPDIGELMAYEDGELDDERTIDLFQRLIDCGLAWKLQGHYGRTACDMINAGVCVFTKPQEFNRRHC